MEAGTTRILVAEDDEHIAALITAYLEREGYEVAVARDGADALRLTAHLAPDAIVLDLMLPKVDG